MPIPVPEDFASGLATLLGGGPPPFDVVRLTGGASSRTYWRVTSAGRSWVVMVLADEPIRSEEAVSGPEAVELPFTEIQRYLEARGVPVPAVHFYDLGRGHVWLDDLGDEMLYARLSRLDGAARVAAYRPAVDLVAAFQRATEGQRMAPICFRRRFEPSLLRWELDHWREWRVEAQLGKTLSPAIREALDRELDALVARIAVLPHSVIHRDFQSTNLMVTARGLVLIDFQDALIGPYCYDLVALLRDSYIALPSADVDELVGHYLSQRPDLDDAAFREAFALQTVQRKLKDAGRFVYIDRVKGNSSYLRWILPSLGYVRAALERAPGLERLSALLADVDPDAFA